MDAMLDQEYLANLDKIILGDITDEGEDLTTPVGDPPVFQDLPYNRVISFHKFIEEISYWQIGTLHDITDRWKIIRQNDLVTNQSYIKKRTTVLSYLDFTLKSVLNQYMNAREEG